MSKKGLFVVKSPKGKVVDMKDLDRDTNTFDNKMTAKAARNKLNEGAGFEQEQVHLGLGFTIGRGPGHWLSKDYG